MNYKFCNKENTRDRVFMLTPHRSEEKKEIPEKFNKGADLEWTSWKRY